LKKGTIYATLGIYLEGANQENTDMSTKCLVRDTKSIAADCQI